MNTQGENQEELDIINTFESENGDKVDFEFTAAQEKSEKLKNDLQKARTRDIYIQQGMRIIITLFFGVLLWVQNKRMYDMVFEAMETNVLDNLQPLFAILTAATITETYYIAKIIVNWVVKDIKYD